MEGFLRILIVDDNRAMRQAIADLLRLEPGWQVCGEAESGIEALEQVQTLRPHLALVDISMPGWDGLETARRLREKNPDLKILIMSAHNPDELQPRAVQAGANGFVDKFRLVPDLRDAIKSV